MITVTVKWLLGCNQSKGVRGEHRITLQVNATFHDLLDKLSENLGDVFIDGLYSPASNEPREDLCFLLNGRNIVFSESLELKLKDEDRLHIIPVPAGG